MFLVLNGSVEPTDRGVVVEPGDEPAMMPHLSSLPTEITLPTRPRSFLTQVDRRGVAHKLRELRPSDHVVCIANGERAEYSDGVWTWTMTHILHAGDVYEDLVGRRTIVAIYEHDVLVRWEPFNEQASANLLSLPKRLFAEGRCGQLVSVVETTR